MRDLEMANQDGHLLENVLDTDDLRKIEDCEQSSGPPASKHTPPPPPAPAPAPAWLGELDKTWKQVLVGFIPRATRNMKYI